MIEKKRIINSTYNRGIFQKVYDSIDLYQLNNVVEIFISESKKNTIRGMHFQPAPYEMNKIIVCLSGKVIDVIVNINKKSKEFGKCDFIELIENESIFVSKDYAHGFYCLEDSRILYITDEIYSKEHESGVLWNSIDFNWPTKDPIISERDNNLKKLQDL